MESEQIVKGLGEVGTIAEHVDDIRHFDRWHFIMLFGWAAAGGSGAFALRHSWVDVIIGAIGGVAAHFTGILTDTNSSRVAKAVVAQVAIKTKVESAQKAQRLTDDAVLNSANP